MRDFRATVPCEGGKPTTQRSMAFKCGASLIAMCGMAAVPVFAQTATRTAQDSTATGTPLSNSTQTNTLPQQTPATGSTDIIVTGIRASLANSQEIKRNSDTVVDAITATDIGALPDRSVTEALQRVPGVEMNRFAGSNDPDHFSVEGSGITVRGLSFVRSEFNGRDAFSAGVYGQAINFSDVPSELLGSVEVYKNTTAAMIEGGLAGTVNLNTRVPLDNKGFHISWDTEMNYGDLSKQWAPTDSLLVSDTWETGAGTFGLLADLSYSQLRSRADGLQVTNFQTRDGGSTVDENGNTVCRSLLPTDNDTMTLPPNGSCDTAETPGADGFADLADTRYAPLGGQFRTQNYDHKRYGIALAGQWESLDHRAKLTAQYLRTDSKSNWGEHTFESAPDLSEYNTYPYGCQPNGNGANGQARAQCPIGSFQNYQYDGQGIFEKGYITLPGTGWRSADPTVPKGGQQQSLSRRQVQDENIVSDYGMNFKFKPNDHWDINLDGDYTKARHDTLDVSVFGSTFADQELDISGDLPVVIPHAPGAAPGPASQDAAYFENPANEFWRAAMDHIEHSEGHEWAFKGDVAYDFDDDDLFLQKITVGVRAAKRDETVRSTAYNWGVLSEVWSGNGGPVWLSQAGGDQAAFYSFDNFFRGQTPGPVGGYYYSGNLIQGYQQFGQFARNIHDIWNTQDKANQSGGWVPAPDRDGVVPGTPFLPSEIQKVTQRHEDAYVMLNFGNDNPIFGGIRLKGNIGVRYVGMRTTSLGNLGVPTAAAIGVDESQATRCTANPANPNPPSGICKLTSQQYSDLQKFATGETSPNLAVTNRHYFLPSINLKFGLTRDLILRLAGSRTLAPPSLGDIRNFLQTGYDADSGQISATAGNPYLKPATADEFDVSLEWYFARVGSLTVDAFYKKIHNFFYSAVVPRDVTSGGVTETIYVRGPANYTGSGKIKGVEVNYQQTFDFLPGFLSGLGVNANYTYLDSQGLPNSFLNNGAPVTASTIPTGKLPLEQLSKHNVNVQLFYEKGPISLRAAYNWRSKFLLTDADVIYPYYPIFNAATGQLDASAFYSLTKNIKIGVQAVNLTDEVTKTEQMFTTSGLMGPRSYFMNDRRYSFIMRANF